MPRSKHTYTFIVRLWREPREIEGATPEWRGSVEIVPNGERRFVKSLPQIIEVIETYLERRPRRGLRE